MWILTFTRHLTSNYPTFYFTYIPKLWIHFLSNVISARVIFIWTFSTWVFEYILLSFPILLFPFFLVFFRRTKSYRQKRYKPLQSETLSNNITVFFCIGFDGKRKRSNTFEDIYTEKTFFFFKFSISFRISVFFPLFSISLRKIQPRKWNC